MNKTFVLFMVSNFLTAAAFAEDVATSQQLAIAGVSQFNVTVDKEGVLSSPSGPAPKNPKDKTYIFENADISSQFNMNQYRGVDSVITVRKDKSEARSTIFKDNKVESSTVCWDFNTQVPSCFTFSHKACVELEKGKASNEMSATQSYKTTQRANEKILFGSIVAKSLPNILDSINELNTVKTKQQLEKDKGKLQESLKICEQILGTENVRSLRVKNGSR